MHNVKNKLKTHKDLDVWKESIKLAKEIYILTGLFPEKEMYGMVSQMRRCAVSISSNPFSTPLYYSSFQGYYKETKAL